MDSCTDYSGARSSPHSQRFRRNGARKRRVGCTECSRHLLRRVSQRRRPLLPPCDGQSEAFSRRVCANGAALGLEPEAGKIYTAGVRSKHEPHAGIGAGPPQFSWWSPARRACSAPFERCPPPRCLPLRFLHQREQRHRRPDGTNYSDEGNKSNGGGGGGVLTIPPQRPRASSGNLQT